MQGWAPKAHLWHLRGPWGDTATGESVSLFVAVSPVLLFAGRRAPLKPKQVWVWACCRGEGGTHGGPSGALTHLLQRSVQLYLLGEASLDPFLKHPLSRFPGLIFSLVCNTVNDFLDLTWASYPIACSPTRTPASRA